MFRQAPGVSVAIEGELRDAYDFICKVGHEVNRAYAIALDDLAEPAGASSSLVGWGGSRSRLDQSFEFDSFWRVADGSEGAEEAQGRLTYDPARGVELAVVDLRMRVPTSSSPPGRFRFSSATICNGSHAPLFDAIATKIEGNLFGGHIREVPTSDRLIYGAQLDSMDDLEIGEVLVDLWGITEWVNGIWDGRVPADPEGARRFSGLKRRLAALWPFRHKVDAPVELPEGEVLNVPLDGAQLILQRGLANREGPPGPA